MASAASGFAVPAPLARTQRSDDAVLERAYNDAAGVTAELNRNALLHLNQRLRADFDVRRFVHRAVWVDAEQRIEICRESTQGSEFKSDPNAQCVRSGHRFAF